MFDINKCTCIFDSSLELSNGLNESVFPHQISTNYLCFPLFHSLKRIEIYIKWTIVNTNYQNKNEQEIAT